MHRPNATVKRPEVIENVALHGIWMWAGGLICFFQGVATEVPPRRTARTASQRVLLGSQDKLRSQVRAMVPDEYSLPRQRLYNDAECVENTGRCQAGKYGPRMMQAGILAILVFIGVICAGLLDSSGLKARLLVGVANTYSDNARVYTFLKKHYSTPGQSARTVAACESLVKLKPTDPVVQALLGGAYVDVGRIQDAIVCFREAISLDPNCFDAHLGLGRAHLERGHYGEAVDSCERALQIQPRSADALLSLGIALSSSGRYDEAMQAFKRAKELDPHIVEPQVLTGRAYLRAGMCEQAIECFKGAVQADAKHAQAYYNLGRAYLQVGDKDLALEQCRTLQQLNPYLADRLHSLVEQ